MEGWGEGESGKCGHQEVFTVDRAKQTKTTHRVTGKYPSKKSVDTFSTNDSKPFEMAMTNIARYL